MVTDLTSLVSVPESTTPVVSQSTVIQTHISAGAVWAQQQRKRVRTSVTIAFRAVVYPTIRMRCCLLTSGPVTEVSLLKRCLLVWAAPFHKTHSEFTGQTYAMEGFEPSIRNCFGQTVTCPTSVDHRSRRLPLLGSDPKEEGLRKKISGGIGYPHEQALAPITGKPPASLHPLPRIGDIS